MNRRHFLTAAAATAGSSMSAFAHSEQPLLQWEKVIKLTHFTAKCERLMNGDTPNIRLEVRLNAPDDPAEQRSRLVLFKLTWDDENISIPDRFWRDLDRLDIEDYPKAALEKIPQAQRWQLEREIEQLKRPRLVLSAEQGSVLIEWQRWEECDSCSTIRWLVTKNGTVLRHRDYPYHEC